MRMMKRKTNLLKVSPLFSEFYGEFSIAIDEDNKLFEDIMHNGITEPLTINKKNEIISGSRRYKIAKMLGIEEVPVIVKDIENINELVIIQNNLHRNKNVVIRTYEYVLLKKSYKSNKGFKKSAELKKQIDAAIKEYNKSNASSTRTRIINSVKLLRELYGLTEKESWKRLILDVDKGSNPFRILNELKAEKERRGNELKSKYREFKSDDFKIITGDTQTEHIKIKNGSVQSLITSPPYFSLRKYSGREKVKSGELPIGEERTAREYAIRQAEIFEKYKPKIKKGGSLFINIMDKVKDGIPCSINYLLMDEMQKRGFIYLQDIIWFKKNPRFLGGRKGAVTSREYIIHFICSDEDYYWDENFLNNNNFDFLMNPMTYGKKDKNKLLYNVIIPPTHNKYFSEKYVGGLISTGVFNASAITKLLNEVGEEFDHPAMYEAEIPLMFIKISSKEGDLILDPYSGMATTGIMAYATNRKYIGIEFDEGYANKSKIRFSVLFNPDNSKKGAEKEGV
jgi:DNA modification methylase